MVHEDHPYSLPVYEFMLWIFPSVLLFPLQTSNQCRSSLLESTNKGKTHFPFDGWIYFSLFKPVLKGRLVIFPGWKAPMGERLILPLTLVLRGISKRDNWDLSLMSQRENPSSSLCKCTINQYSRVGASLASNYMDESLATFFHIWITIKIVGWLLFTVFEERRTEQICCHATPHSTLAKLFQHATFKATSLKLSTSSRTYTFNSGQVLYFLINLIFSQIGFCNMMSANSSNFWYEMWSSLTGWQTSIWLASQTLMNSLRVSRRPVAVGTKTYNTGTIQFFSSTSQEHVSQHKVRVWWWEHQDSSGQMPSLIKVN